MPRVVSFIVLLAVVLLLGLVFFKVMAQFLVPLFLAAVLVVVFKPLHLWILEKCKKRYRIAAALTTLAIVLIFLLPLCGLTVKAVAEAVTMLRDTTSDGQINTESIQELIEKAVAAINQGLTKFNLPEQSSDEIFAVVQENLETFVAPVLFGSAGMLIGAFVSLCITTIATYYFFADGPAMVRAIMKMSPMEDAYEKELLDKFSDISRAVVLATLLSALIQGLLAGVGYYFTGVENVFLWTALTTVFAMVPFVGATAIWAPLCLYLYFVVDDRTTSAIVLAIYGSTVVSMSDNLIKPFILHGQANLHPLLALLSVIGGVQVLGPIGILVGPMLVAFFQALLNMLNKELQLLGRAEKNKEREKVSTTTSSETSEKTALAQDEPQSPDLSQEPIVEKTSEKA